MNLLLILNSDCQLLVATPSIQTGEKSKEENPCMDDNHLDDYEQYNINLYNS